MLTAGGVVVIFSVGPVGEGAGDAVVVEVVVVLRGVGEAAVLVVVAGVTAAEVS